MPLVDSDQQPPRAAGRDVDPAVSQAYWAKTSGLMWTMLVIWAVASFAVHFFASSLNTIQVFGFPLGFYMAAQGSLIIFVVMLFWFARRQNSIDEELGVEEH